MKFFSLTIWRVSRSRDICDVVDHPGNRVTSLTSRRGWPSAKTYKPLPSAAAVALLLSLLFSSLSLTLPTGKEEDKNIKKVSSHY